MKNFLISLNLIILAFFFTVNQAYCEEDFFTNSGFKEAKSQSTLAKNTNKKTKGFFKKKNKDEDKGYYGTLPDIESAFRYKKQTSSKSTQTKAKVPDEEDLKDDNLKKAPVDDALFLDVIVKKEKSSTYSKDLQRVKFSLSNLKKCIEENGDIQRFNAAVNMVDLYSKNLQEKYENKSESLKESYIDILSTNYHAKVLGNLMYDANYYSRYVPTSTGQYSKDNISSEQQKLLNKVNKTIFLINQEILD